MDAYEAGAAERVPGRPFSPSVRFLIAAITVARTPDVPLPEHVPAPAPTREEAEA